MTNTHKPVYKTEQTDYNYILQRNITQGTGMKVKKTDSKGYICTLDMTKDSDIDFLYSTRRSISVFNKKSAVKGRVIAKSVKPFITGTPRDAHSNIKGGIDNARKIDLYIYYS